VIDVDKTIEHSEQLARIEIGSTLKDASESKKNINFRILGI